MHKRICDIIKATILSFFHWVNNIFNNMPSFSKKQLIPIRYDPRKPGKNYNVSESEDFQRFFWIFLILIFLLFGAFKLGFAQDSLFANGGSLDIPVKGYGLSIGNSREFTGLRLNFRDRHVQQINGINLTIWRSDDNKKAEVNGLSFGLMPEAGTLNGVSLGILGVSAEKNMYGINLGLIGAGSSGNISGLNIGGIGIGAGNNMSGISLGLIGAGAGGNLTGIAIGGIGVGAGGNITGIAIGGIGAGASGDIKGIAIGGIGAGAGENMTGINIGLIGVGTGNNMTGISFGLVGAGCGNKLTGITIGGIGAGAPIANGLMIGGIAAGGHEITGVTFASGMMKIDDDGKLTGFSASAFNQIKGQQDGVTLGILNYARKLNGFQFGLINYVRDNPKFLRILPILNFHFD